MNKSDLINLIAESADITKKQATDALNGFLGAVTEALAKNETVTLVGFGTFKTTPRAERQGRNPRTGETMTIAAANVPSFKAGSDLKAKVNN